MITVKLDWKRITVEGHASFAPRGQDIVCAAASALTLTLANGLARHASMNINAKFEPGFGEINWNTITASGTALLLTYEDGIRDIAESYPGSVKILDNKGARASFYRRRA